MVTLCCVVDLGLSNLFLQADQIKRPRGEEECIQGSGEKNKREETTRKTQT
jgi:hypothetical protein